MLFEDRKEAGKLLAARLLDDPLVKDTNSGDLLILSIPRGGVEVGAVVAQVLGCEHDVIVVKKIGFPGYEELAIGAVAEDGLVILNERIAHEYPVEDDYVKQEIARIQARVASYIQQFRHGEALHLRSRTVIVVDDGIATGETIQAAVQWLKSRDDPNKPAQVLVAVPVCPPMAAAVLESLADKFICLSIPEHFWAVGQFYREFRQISDEEVLAILRTAESVRTAA